MKKIYVTLEGGLVQGVSSPTPVYFNDVEVIVVDYSQDPDPVTLVAQFDGDPSPDPATVTRHAVDNTSISFVECVVNVGNLGNILVTTDKTAADECYEQSVHLSRTEYGRYANEPVILFVGDRIEKEYQPDGAIPW